MDNLRSHLAAAESARATWQQRATSAEQRVEELRGEVVALRQMLGDIIQGVICSGSGSIAPCFDAEDYAVERARGQWYAVEGKAIQRIDSALLATPRAAQLGTLVEAALSCALSYDRWRKRDEGDLPAVWVHLLLSLEVVNAAADAVLAREVRT